MRASESELLREVPGGARRADTFLLVVATVLEVGTIVGFRSWHPPLIPLIVTSAWLQVVARWLRHMRPQYARTTEFVGTLALGAALYAVWTA